MSNESMDLISLIIKDHETVKELHHKIEKANSAKEKQALAFQIIKELCLHAHTEEVVLYPVIKEKLENGVELANKALTEHKEAKKILYQLDKLSVADDIFPLLYNDAMVDTLAHVEEEERILLPKLKDALSKEELIDLGKKFEATKKIVPTRPHPSMPNEPPANIEAAKKLAPQDRQIDQQEIEELRR